MKEKINYWASGKEVDCFYLGIKERFIINNDA